MSQDKQQALLKRLRRTLDQAVEELDPVTRSRLQAARRTALASRKPPPLWQNRLLLASAMSVTLLVGVWLLQKPTLEDLPLEDMHILTANEDLELYRDLEFYQWLAYQNEQG